MDNCKAPALSEEYADFILRSHIPFPESFGEIGNTCSTPISPNHFCLYAPLDEVLPLTIDKFPYNTIPNLFTIEDTSPLENSGIIRLQNQPILNLKGQGTIIGIIDTGIDYTHEAFLDKYGNSRIISIWDQTNNEGTPPIGQFYGTEYTNDMINLALHSDDPYSIVPETDDNGHGTFIAGVACGSESILNSFIGAAPLADIIVVKLKPAKNYLRDYYFVRDDALCYQENDIMFAISYIALKKLNLNRPLSLIIGLGSNRGDHNGTGNLSFTLNRLAEDTNTGISVSMGNEGNKRLHYSGSVLNTTTPDTVELRIDDRQKGLYMEIWGQNPQIYSISVTSPTGEVLNRIPPRLNVNENYTFLFEQTILQVEYKLVESSSGFQLILLRFINPTSGIWRINIYGENNLIGNFNCWLPVSAFLYENTYFIRSNPEITLTVPAAAGSPISVATYNSYNNAIFVSSSRGFTMEGRVKPDIAAPGVNITGPVAGGGYTKKSGSSIAAALTAGAVAQFFTWGITNKNYPGLENSDIKSYIIRGATRLNSDNYPNPEWGYGALNIYDAFEVMRGNVN